MTPTVRNFLICLASAALLTACGDDNNDNNGGTNNDTNNVTNNANNTTNNTTNNVTNNTTNNVTNNTTNNTAPAVEEVDCATATAAATVAMDGNAFVPAATTVSAGDVVEFSNDDAVPHTVTSGRSGDGDSGDLFDSAALQGGETYCLQFNDPGTVEYWCTFHPGTMNDGVITVE